jgi:hypothetical protein
LGDEVEEEGGFAGAQEAGYDCDWDGRHDEELGLVRPVVEVVEGFENEMSDIFGGGVFLAEGQDRGTLSRQTWMGRGNAAMALTFFWRGVWWGYTGPGLWARH